MPAIAQSEKNTNRTVRIRRFQLLAVFAMAGWQIFLVDTFLQLGWAGRYPVLATAWFRWTPTVLALLVAGGCLLRGVLCPQCKVKCEWALPFFVCPGCGQRLDPGRIRGVD